MKSAIKRAVKKAGNQSKLARICGVTPQAVQQWVASDRVPAAQVITIEKATGVNRCDLRADLYPRD